MRWWRRCQTYLQGIDRRGRIAAISVTIFLACVVGVVAGYGAALFSFLIHSVSTWTVQPFANAGADQWLWLSVLVVVPALGLLVVSWFTLRFAPEAQGRTWRSGSHLRRGTPRRGNSAACVTRQDYCERVVYRHGRIGGA